MKKNKFKLFKVKGARDISSKPKSIKKKIFKAKFFIYLFSFCLIWLAISASLLYIFYIRKIPTIDEIKSRIHNQTVNIVFKNGEPISTIGQNKQNLIQYYELPQTLVDAVISIEDRKFFEHDGYDILAIIRAFYVNQIHHKKLQGGSTITQQLAKMSFLEPKKTLSRKIQELILSIKIERNFTKEEIFELYLNKAYFGSGNYGVKNAAFYYFNKDVSELNLYESALLAGMLKAPSKYSLENNQELSKKRAKVVISTMIENEVIKEEEVDLKKLDEISFKFNMDQNRYFSDIVYRVYKEYVPKDTKYNNLKIYTTLDYNIQNRVNITINSFIKDYAKTLDNAELGVLILNKKGEILATIGGKDYRQNQFNHVFDIKRQPGSLFKVFTYLAAFEEGYEPDDEMEDRELSIADWSPSNYNNEFLGDVTLREAFAKSINSIAVQLYQELGSKKVALLAKKLGINSDINSNDLTTSLGSFTLSLAEVTNAYASIANDGRPVIINYINNIEDEFGNELYKRRYFQFNPVVSDESISYIKEVLREVVENGTGHNANTYFTEVYGKTGTSQNYRDAWFVGFDDNYVIGIWIGNDNSKPTKYISGGTLPAILFKKILENVYRRY